MKKNQRQFILNCAVEELVAIVQEEQKLPLIEAFGKVYNSRLYETLADTHNGLYIQSPLYQYQYLKEEL